MSFNPERAEALRTAIIGTAQTLQHFPDGDGKTLLTEHLALLHEAELIYLTDAFVGEGDELAPYPDPRVDDGHSDLDVDPSDPHAELRKTWAPGQRWQFRSSITGNWLGCSPAKGPEWAASTAYRRHPDDIDSAGGRQ